MSRTAPSIDVRGINSDEQADRRDEADGQGEILRIAELVERIQDGPGAQEFDDGVDGEEEDGEVQDDPAVSRCGLTLSLRSWFLVGLFPRFRFYQNVE